MLAFVYVFLLSISSFSYTLKLKSDETGTLPSSEQKDSKRSKSFAGERKIGPVNITVKLLHNTKNWNLSPLNSKKYFSNNLSYDNPIRLYFQEQTKDNNHGVNNDVPKQEKKNEQQTMQQPIPHADVRIGTVIPSNGKGIPLEYQQSVVQVVDKLTEKGAPTKQENLKPVIISPKKARKQRTEFPNTYSINSYPTESKTDVKNTFPNAKGLIFRKKTEIELFVRDENQISEILKETMPDGFYDVIKNLNNQPFTLPHDGTMQTEVLEQYIVTQASYNSQNAINLQPISTNNKIPQNKLNNNPEYPLANGVPSSTYENPLLEKYNPSDDNKFLAENPHKTEYIESSEMNNQAFNVQQAPFTNTTRIQSQKINSDSSKMRPPDQESANSVGEMSFNEFKSNLPDSERVIGSDIALKIRYESEVKYKKVQSPPNFGGRNINASSEVKSLPPSGLESAQIARITTRTPIQNFPESNPQFAEQSHSSEPSNNKFGDLEVIPLKFKNMSKSFSVPNENLYASSTHGAEWKLSLALVNTTVRPEGSSNGTNQSDYYAVHPRLPSTEEEVVTDEKMLAMHIRPFSMKKKPEKRYGSTPTDLEQVQKTRGINTFFPPSPTVVGVLSRMKRGIDDDTTTGKHLPSSLHPIDLEYGKQNPTYDGCCYNGGTCFGIHTSRKISRHCACNPPFTGRYCESKVDECKRRNIHCKRHEVCNITKGTYSCFCGPDYVREGDDCIPAVTCEEFPCLNGADCEDTEDGHFVCHCPLGYRGKMCDIRVPQCEDSSCSKDQICVSTVTGYECLTKEQSEAYEI